MTVNESGGSQLFVWMDGELVDDSHTCCRSRQKRVVVVYLCGLKTYCFYLIGLETSLFLPHTEVHFCRSSDVGP